MRRFHEGILEYKEESRSCILEYFLSFIHNYSFVSYKYLGMNMFPWFFPMFVKDSYISFLPRNFVWFTSEEASWPVSNKSWASMLYREDSESVKLYFFDLEATYYIYSKFPILLYNLLFLFPKKRQKLITKFVSWLDNMDVSSSMFFTCFDKEDLYEIQSEA